MPTIPADATLFLSCAQQELQADGYDVGKIPEEEGDLIKSVLNDDEVPTLCHQRTGVYATSYRLN